MPDEISHEPTNKSPYRVWLEEMRAMRVQLEQQRVNRGAEITTQLDYVVILRNAFITDSELDVGSIAVVIDENEFDDIITKSETLSYAPCMEVEVDLAEVVSSIIEQDDEGPDHLLKWADFFEAQARRLRGEASSS